MASSMFDLEIGGLRRKLRLGPPLVAACQVAFSPEARHLATVNGNGTVYIVRLEKFQPVKP